MSPSPTVSRPLSRKAALRVLAAIRLQVAPLQPPVASFERQAGRSPFRILVSVLLSARTQDPVTEGAARRLFAAAKTPASMLALGEERIRELIYPVGFYRRKAAHIVGLCRVLEATGGVPPTQAGLTALPGVGRKTANLVLALAFAQPAIAVDTHVFRISRRLGWAASGTPEEVEDELRNLFPPSAWSRINQALVGFGQTLCRPQRPRCGECAVRGDCAFVRARGAARIQRSR